MYSIRSICNYFILFYLLVIWDRVSLCSCGWLKLYVDQPPSVTLVLGLKVCTTSSAKYFKSNWNEVNLYNLFINETNSDVLQVRRDYVQIMVCKTLKKQKAYMYDYLKNI